MDELAVRLGRFLHILRESYGLSLRELSSRCGMSISFLCYVENGRSRIPWSRLERLLRFGYGMDAAAFLRVFADWLEDGVVDLPHPAKRAILKSSTSEVECKQRNSQP